MFRHVGLGVEWAEVPPPPTRDRVPPTQLLWGRALKLRLRLMSLAEHGIPNQERYQVIALLELQLFTVMPPTARQAVTRRSSPKPAQTRLP